MSSLSVAIPALNEEKSVKETVENVVKAVQRCNNISKYEIILINDGSTDNTLKIMREIAGKNKFIKIIDNKCNKGLGYSYKRGLQETMFDYYNWVPSDNTFSSESLYKLYSQIGYADIILHYPAIQNRKLYRILISFLHIKLLNLIFKINKIKYYNGLPIYKRDDIKDIKIRALGFAFQAELLIKVLKSKKMSIIQVPVLTTERIYGNTKAFQFKNVIDLFKSFYWLYKDIKM